MHEHTNLVKQFAVMVVNNAEDETIRQLVPVVHYVLETFDTNNAKFAQHVSREDAVYHCLCFHGRYRIDKDIEGIDDEKEDLCYNASVHALFLLGITHEEGKEAIARYLKRNEDVLQDMDGVAQKYMDDVHDWFLTLIDSINEEKKRVLQ